MVTVPTLNLIRETKICDRMTCEHQSKRWEASGVLVKDGNEASWAWRDDGRLYEFPRKPSGEWLIRERRKAS